MMDLSGKILIIHLFLDTFEFWIAFSNLNYFLILIEREKWRPIGAEYRIT